jgi:hypothetical protein
VFVTKTVDGGVRAADKVLNKMVADHEAGKPREGSETVSDLMVRWLEHSETKGLPPFESIGGRQGERPARLRRYETLEVACCRPRPLVGQKRHPDWGGE